MAIIYSYPTVIPTVDDLLLGTDVTATGNPTKNFTIESLITLIQGDDRGLGYVLNQSGDARFVNPDGSFGPNQSAFNFLNLQGTGSVAFASFSTVGGISINGTVGSGFSAITSTNLTGALLSTGQAGQIASSVQAITQTPNDNSTKIATTEYVDSIVDPSILTFTGTTGGDQTVTLVNETFSLLGTANQIESVSAGQSITFNFPAAGVTLPDGSIATTQPFADSSQKIATTAFVQQEITGQDLDFSGTTGTGSVDLDSQTLAITGTTSQISTNAAAQGLAIALTPSVTITGTYTGATFAGDLLGTINTATTGVTQAPLNNSTLIATTAYVEAASSAKTLTYKGDLNTAESLNLSTDTLFIDGGSNITTSTIAVTGNVGSVIVNLDDTVTISGTMQAGTLSDGTFSGTAGTYTGGVSITSTTFVGALTGNALTASALDDPGTVSMSGDAVAAGVTYTNGGDVPLVSTISDSVVYNKTLSGFNATTGSVQDGDSIIEALERLQGQITTLPQGLVYQGVWSAAGTGGGTPDLTVAGTKVNGHFYICDTAGSAAPNGTGTTPNDWDVRDWVIFADDGAGGGVDEWQKIDNSSLAGGSGTTNTITKWTNNQVIGNSTITDDGSTVTIADTVDFITQGNNTFGNTSADVSSFLGNVTLSENLILEKGLALDSSSSVPYGSAGQVLTSGGNINIANTWTTPTIGTVTSVALTETGDALTITGSPVTSSGTINIAGAGASTDYINGELNLVAFPTSDNYVSWTADSDEGTDITVTSGFNLKFTGAVTAGGAGIATDSAVSANEMTIGLINAGGTPGATTFYRGDGQWSVPVGTKTETLTEVLVNGNTAGAKNIIFPDSTAVTNGRVTFGAGTDLSIYHDPSVAGQAFGMIDCSTGTGLQIRSTQLGQGHVFVKASNVAGNSLVNYIDCDGGSGRVFLYYNGQSRFSTNSSGIQINGTSEMNGVVTVNTSGSSSMLVVNDSSAGNVRLDIGVDSGVGVNYMSRDGSGYGTHIFQQTDGTTPKTVMTLKADQSVQLSEYGSGTITGTPTYNLEVDSSGNVIETPSTNPGGGGGTFHGDQAITVAGGATLAFTLTRATTGTMVFDVWLTSETGAASSVAKKYVVAHSYNTTPVYNKILDTGPRGSADFNVSFIDSGVGATGTSCKCILTAVSDTQNIGYTVQVGYDSTNALTFTAAS